MTKPILFLVSAGALLASVACSDDDDRDADAALEADAATAACGALTSCTASKYCEETTPGQCGGTPLSDAGTCPPNCSATICPGDDEACVCRSYTCRPLGACTDCACLEQQSPGCSCTVGEGGILQLACALP